MNFTTGLSNCKECNNVIIVKLKALEAVFVNQNMVIDSEALASFSQATPMPELMGWNWSKRFDDNAIA